MEFRTRRATSPGSRRIAHGGSSSTGTLKYPSAFDQYQGPSRSSAGFMSGPRTNAERAGIPRVQPRYRLESPSRQSSRDDYVIRPRRLTLDPQDAASRRPLSFVPPSSPSRLRPIITNAVDNPPLPLTVATRSRRDEDYYIQPASSTRREYRRNYPSGSTDATRLDAGDREARDRWEHGGYRRPSSIRGAYNTDPSYPRRPDIDERDPGYEYTNRREQVYRDTEPRPRPRRDSNAGRRERPISMAGLEDYLPRVNTIGREPGPPVAMDRQGFSVWGTNLGRSGSLRQHHQSRDDELPLRDYNREGYDASQSQKPSHVPVLHQAYPDEYSTHRKEVRDPMEVRSRKHHAPSATEERKDRGRNDHLDEQYGRTKDDRSTRYHDRGDRDHRMREDDRNYGQEISTNVLLASAAASAAGTGVVGESEKRRHYHQDRKKDDSDPAKGRIQTDDRARRTKGNDAQEDTSSSTEGSDEEKPEGRQRHKPHSEPRDGKEVGDHRKSRGDKEADDRRRIREAKEGEDQRKVREAKEGEDQRKVREAKEGEDQRKVREAKEVEDRTLERDSYSEDSTGEAREQRDSREKKQRQVRVVTPSEDYREAEPPIKGILRQPREKFPEDPAPVREGVALHKTAGKKGVPPTARWTKIDRKLVNPEALEAGNERFEERPDYVIVLRVLTKEDIEAYTLKTHEIRAKRGIPPM
jgi:zinc finger CCCH domain-containing protein 13